MGGSRAAQAAAVQPDDHTSASALLEFAVSQALIQDPAAPEAGLPELLRRAAAVFGSRAAVALRLGEPGEQVIIAAYPPAAVDPRLMAQLSELLITHPGVVSAGGCVQGPVAWAGLGPGRNRSPALAAVARLPGSSFSCALIMVGQQSHWTAEAQSTCPGAGHRHRGPDPAGGGRQGNRGTAGGDRGADQRGPGCRGDGRRRAEDRRLQPGRRGTVRPPARGRSRPEHGDLLIPEREPGHVPGIDRGVPAYRGPGEVHRPHDAAHPAR